MILDGLFCAVYGDIGKDKPIPIAPPLPPYTTFLLHLLIKQYATLLYDAGVDVKSAQRYLGHANLELTLKVYTHLTKYKEGKSMEYYNKMLEEKGMIEQAVNR